MSHEAKTPGDTPGARYYSQAKSDPNTAVKPRDIEDGPFCWQPKPALKLIRDSLDGAHAVASGLCVYLALSEIASDEQAPEFVTTQSWIALKSGLGVRTVWARLKDFERLKLITVETTAWSGPAKYTLVALSNGCGTSSNSCGTLRNGRKQTSLQRSEESQNNHRRISKGARARRPQAWQVSKDLARVEKQLHDERQSTNPDHQVINALKGERKNLRALLKSDQPALVEKHATAPALPAQPAIEGDREVSNEDWAKLRKEAGL